MPLLLLLILFPLVIALAIPFLKNETVRSSVVKIASCVLIIASVALLIANFHRAIHYYKADSSIIDKAMFIIEIALSGYLLYLGFKYKRPWTVILVILQATITIGYEIFIRPSVTVNHNLFMDKLSILMVQVIGIVGSLICIYATGYMRDFHEKYHKDVKDRRRFFFFVIFVFMSAMFGIVFSNNLMWLYFFWELTTISSFLLIGYKGTQESIRNSFLALEMNLVGGVTFILAIVYLSIFPKVIELDRIFLLGKAIVLLPVALICCSGLIKSAQIPFSAWLVGAMVAPTPVSALLHSSTMVKAGVYIMLRLGVFLMDTVTGYFLAMIGGITFMLCSLIAISQENAKKVLAYSTVANLGLIVVCAGVGTYEAMWAGILLIVFHAVAKCLLFMGVGIIEPRTHSLEIEDMSGLIIRMPKISIMMQIGIAGMFVAPFGMLISKWAALKALVDYNPLLAIFVVFGGSATIFFWVKWIGKLISVTKTYKDIEGGIQQSIWIPLYALTSMTVGVCAFFPVLCSVFIEPFLIEMYGKTVVIGQGNIVIMILMLAMIMLFPLSFIFYGKKVSVSDAYLGGANIDTSSTQFQGSAGAVRSMKMKNYYMDKYFGEAKLYKFGFVLCLILLITMIVVSKL